MRNEECTSDGRFLIPDFLFSGFGIIFAVVH